MPYKETRSDNRIYIHGLTPRQHRAIKTVAAMCDMSLSAFASSCILNSLIKMRVSGKPAVQAYLKEEIPTEDDLKSQTAKKA